MKTALRRSGLQVLFCAESESSGFELILCMDFDSFFELYKKDVYEVCVDKPEKSLRKFRAAYYVLMALTGAAMIIFLLFCTLGLADPDSNAAGGCIMGVYIGAVAAAAFVETKREKLNIGTWSASKGILYDPVRESRLEAILLNSGIWGGSITETVALICFTERRREAGQSIHHMGQNFKSLFGGLIYPLVIFAAGLVIAQVDFGGISAERLFEISIYLIGVVMMIWALVKLLNMPLRLLLNRNDVVYAYLIFDLSHLQIFPCMSEDDPDIPNDREV